MTDKYPVESDRRRFVKGVVGGGALAGTSSGALTALETATPTQGEGGGQVLYYGVENTDGPANDPMPQLPVTVEGGELHGVWPEGDGEGMPSTELGGITYTPRWFQYCSVESAEGLQPGTDRGTALTHAGPETTHYDWQLDREKGTPLAVEEFDDYEAWEDGVGDPSLGKPAVALWRADADDETTMVVQVIRSRRIERLAADSEWLAASTERGFMAFFAKCTPSVASRGSSSRRLRTRRTPTASTAPVTSRATTRSRSSGRTRSSARAR